MDSPVPVADEIKLWSCGQQEAFSVLLEMAEAFFETAWPESGLRPRLDPMMAGPSGVGKSHVVRAVAQRLKLPILRLTYNEWLVIGAREHPYTLARVHTYVENNNRGLIHVDELDKFKSTHRTDWSTSVNGELLLLLDRSLQQPTRGTTWTPFMQAKLRKSFLIIGSGTWQLTWSENAKPRMGFQNSIAAASGMVQKQIEKSEIIPVELFRRFNSELIILPPATEADYRRGAEIYDLERMARELGVELDYANAVERSLGARWLEEALARLLRIARKQGIQLFPPIPAPMAETADEPDFDFEELSGSDADIPF
jgi:SpoVK/Ycf46/Vps4 family AAA+-type ATPase